MMVPWEKIMPEPNSGCWLWFGGEGGGYVSGQRYGVHYANRKMNRAHRFVYEQIVGPVPEGLVLDHKCRTPCCVNPAHLEPVTQKENSRRGVTGQTSAQQQRAKTHCPHGHSYSGENLYVRANGHRGCKQCRRNAVRRRRRNQ